MAKEKCDTECIDGFSQNGWGIWASESDGGTAPQCIFKDEEEATAYANVLRAHCGMDYAVLPVVISDAVVHNCHVGNDGVHIDHAAALKIEKRAKL